MSERQEKVAEELLKLAGAYIAREANRNHLITPTHVSISPDLRKATIYISVFPTNNEEGALAFLKRNRSDFRSFVKRQISFKVLPFIDFVIDEGEKNRQRTDALSTS